MRGGGPLLRALPVVLSVVLLTGCSQDCLWGGRAQAWIDRDANGVWDAGEPPLPGVTFSVVDARSKSRWAQGVSDASGGASLHFLYGCDRREWEVQAQPPAGYRRTTPERVRDGTPFRFGFAPTEAR